MQTNPDYCECCGNVEVFDGKVCKQCEELVARIKAGAVDIFDNEGYNQERLK